MSTTITATATTVADTVPAALGGVIAALPAGSCLVVREGERSVASVHPDLGLIPASTMKLVLASAAIDRFGSTRAASITEMLQKSDKGTADLLTTDLGGTSALRTWVGTSGLQRSGIVINDGDGFARTNRLSCSFLVDLLDRVGPFSQLASALPVAGESGTLKTWFVGTAAVGRLRAKTGTLLDVRSLAGFVGAKSGRQFVFAIIVNDRNAARVGDSILTEVGTVLAGA